MTQRELATALGGYFAALGVSSDRAAFCVPYLTGAKALPSEAAAVHGELVERAKDAALCTYPEAGRLLGCSRSTVFRLVKDGTLSPVVFRGKNKLRLAEVLAVGKRATVVCGCAATPEGSVLAGSQDLAEKLNGGKAVAE